MECIRRVRMGETDMFEDLLEPHLHAAARLTYGMLQDRTAAEDAVWEAARLAWQRLGNLHPGILFRSWFFSNVANCCRETRRTSASEDLIAIAETASR